MTAEYQKYGVGFVGARQKFSLMIVINTLAGWQYGL